MKVNIHWLKDWVEFDLSDTELSQRLTMSGLEVESVTPVDCHDKVVVGSVSQVQPHPKKDNLKVCLVDIGKDSPVQVICGGPNLSVGGKYPMALVGSQVGEVSVGETPIHGETSFGMLCSSGELGFDDTKERLMDLDSDAPIGQSLNEYHQLHLPDSVLDFELTPNRADCLSIRGVAREVAIIADKSIADFPIPPIKAESSSQVPVSIRDAADCPIYCGRVIEGINSQAKTPDWMIARLNRVGLRSIHPVVDITNYVMIELGQPMHAFDMDIFDSSEIIVRRSQSGEKLTLLDGEELNLGEGILLIADKDGPNGLAGVMGGGSSGIRSETRNIFLEAAFFSPQAIRRSVSRFGKHTDASHRFERGVEPGAQAAAMERATALILEIAGGTPGSIQELRNDDYIPVKQACTVRQSRIKRILGISIPKKRIESILRAVNDSVKEVPEGWEVIPPAYRFDLEKEYDQIEEIARIYGYDNIPSTVSFAPNSSTGIRETTVREDSIRNLLHLQGYYEAITYSFVDPKLQDRFKPDVKPKHLANPISENMSVMRTSLWPGLIEAFQENYRRNKDSIRLFEIGRIFLPDGEVDMLGGLCFGLAAPTQWGDEDRPIDFFDLKGDLYTLLDLTGCASQVALRAEEHAGLHPGSSAGIYFGQEKCGMIGQVHPEILNEIKSEEKVFVFELELSVLSTRSLNQYQAISRFPPSVRDISILVPADISVAEISNEIEGCAQENLENHTLFDVYFGAGIDAKLKSVAYRLTFRSHDRTLTDTEVNTSVQYLLDRLNQRFGAQLREQTVQTDE